MHRFPRLRREPSQFAGMRNSRSGCGFIDDAGPEHLLLKRPEQDAIERSAYLRRLPKLVHPGRQRQDGRCAPCSRHTLAALLAGVQQVAVGTRVRGHHGRAVERRFDRLLELNPVGNRHQIFTPVREKRVAGTPPGVAGRTVQPDVITSLPDAQ